MDDDQIDPVVPEDEELGEDGLPLKKVLPVEEDDAEEDVVDDDEIM